MGRFLINITTFGGPEAAGPGNNCSFFFVLFFKWCITLSAAVFLLSTVLKSYTSQKWCTADQHTTGKQCDESTKVQSKHSLDSIFMLICWVVIQTQSALWSLTSMLLKTQIWFSWFLTKAEHFHAHFLRHWKHLRRCKSMTVFISELTAEARRHIMTVLPLSPVPPPWSQVAVCIHVCPNS